MTAWVMDDMMKNADFGSFKRRKVTTTNSGSVRRSSYCSLGSYMLPGILQSHTSHRLNPQSLKELSTNLVTPISPSTVHMFGLLYCSHQSEEFVTWTNGIHHTVLINQIVQIANCTRCELD
jgi:hypothetical protein